MNWELITQGLELSVMGILTTFMSLGLFIGTILLLRMVFPTEPRKRKQAVVEPVAEESEPLVMEEVVSAVDTDAVSAAISAAIYVQMLLSTAPEDGTMVSMEAGFSPQNYRSQRRGLGARLEQPRGRWWQPMGDNEQGK